MTVQNKSAVAATGDALERLRKRLKYEGGGPQNTPLPASAAALIADYNTMFDALTLVKADGAFGGLAVGTRNAVTNAGF